MPDSASRATVRGEQSWLCRPIPIEHNIKIQRKKIQLDIISRTNERRSNSKWEETQSEETQ